MHCVTPSFNMGINVLVTEMNKFSPLIADREDNNLKQTIPCSESLVVPGRNCHHYSKQNYPLKLQFDIRKKNSGESINCMKYNH